MKSVGTEFFDRDGGAVGQIRLVHQSEAAVADDQIGGEVPSGLEELRQRDLAQRRVKRCALSDLHGIGNSSRSTAVVGTGPAVFFLTAEDEDEGEN